MKKLVFIATLLFFAAGCSQPDPATEKLAIEGAVKGFYAAIEKSDATALKSFCTPDFAGFEDGQAFNIDTFISILGTMEPGSIKIIMDFVRTDVGRDLSHCIIKFDGRFIMNKKPVHAITYENYILKKTDGKWLICAYHSTHLNGPKQLTSGCILGLHTYDKLDLKPGVTLAQAEDFWFNRFTPAFNKLTDEMQVIPLRGDRGEGKDKFGYIVYIASGQVRDSNWNAEGKPTPKGEELFKKMAPIFEEQDKLFKVNKDIYTDWIVE